MDLEEAMDLTSPGCSLVFFSRFMKIQQLTNCHITSVTQKRFFLKPKYSPEEEGIAFGDCRSRHLGRRQTAADVEASSEEKGNNGGAFGDRERQRQWRLPRGRKVAGVEASSAEEATVELCGMKNWVKRLFLFYFSGQLLFFSFPISVFLFSVRSLLYTFKRSFPAESARKF
ncbi:hypothetical protein LXL04_017174 [Taraxacum kok-saghyz]